MGPNNISRRLTVDDGQSLATISTSSIPQGRYPASQIERVPACLRPLSNGRRGATRPIEPSIRNAAVASIKTAGNCVTLFDSASADSSLTRTQRLGRASTAINEAVQASGFTDVEALFHEIHIVDGPSAFYVTDANVRVLQIDAALLLKSRENQLIELLHELAHAERHRLKCGFHGPHYRDDSSLNERTVERFAALKAAAWIKRFPSPLNDAGRLDHASGANAVALNMRFGIGLAPANRVVLRQWFREGAATPEGQGDEPARPNVGSIAFARISNPYDERIVEARGLDNGNLRIAFERSSNERLPGFINVPLDGIPPEKFVDIVVPVVSQFIELYRDEIDKGITFSLLPPAMQAAISASDLDLARAMQTMMAHHGFGRVNCRFEDLVWPDTRLIVERQVPANEPPRPTLPASITTDAGDFQLKTADLFFPAPALDRSSPVEPPSLRYVPEGYFYVEVEGTADGAFLHPEGRRMNAHEMIYLLLTSIDDLVGPGDAVAWRIRNMPDQLAAACAQDLADIMGGSVFVPASSAVTDAGEFVAPHPEQRRSNGIGLGKAIGKGDDKIFFERGWGEDRVIAVARLHPEGYEAAARVFDDECEDVELARSSGAPVIACRRGEDLFGQPVLEFDEKIVFTIDAVTQARDRSAFPLGNEAALVEIDTAEAWARDHGVRMSDTPEGGLVTSGGFRLFDLTGLVYDEGAGLDPLLANLFENARRGLRARIAMDAAGNDAAPPNSAD